MHTLRLTKFHQLLLASLVVALGLVLFAGSARAANFVVDSTGDEADINPGDGVCETSEDTCTLRAGIEEANALGGSDVINFNIAGAGVQTITPGSELPNITEALVIDGTTQTGASCGDLVPDTLPAGSNTPHTLLIEIDGQNNSGGFIIAANAPVTIRGLVFNNAVGGLGLGLVAGATNSLVECNYIGTNAAGTAAIASDVGLGIGDVAGVTVQNNLISGSLWGLYTESSVPDTTIRKNLIGTAADGITAIPNQLMGVYILASFSDISGTSITHNIISGNDGAGLGIFEGSQYTVQDNYIGINMAGNPLGNTGYGVQSFGTSSFTIGGTGASQRNYISANGGGGMHIYRDCYADSNIYDGTIYNNYIGTNLSGAVEAGYGNQGPGIEVNEYYGSCASVYKIAIGGDDAGEANVIAGNSGQGILIHQSSSQDVFSISAIVNSIYNNGEFGIDLASDSDFNNGVADVDLGPNPLNNNLMTYPAINANYYLNRPTINTASFSGSDISVNYDFQANAVQANPPYLETSDLVGYRLDFYLNDAGQDGAYAGYSQGKTHIGSFVVNGSETNATHTFTSPVTPTAGQVVTATATVLWQNIPNPCPIPGRYGDGPPYTSTSCE